MRSKNKIILLGESGVGKTSILRRWLTNSFNDNQQPTIGSAFSRTQFNFRGQTHDIQVWDTAGEERFRSMAPIYAQGAFAAALVYDRTVKESFEVIDQFYQIIKSLNVPVIICGNKSDMENLVVSEEEGSEYANKIGGTYFCTSAMNGFGINEAFEKLLYEAFIIKENNPDEILMVATEVKKSSCC